MHQNTSPPAVLPLTFPARPTNGGPLEKALPKSGRWLYEPKYNGWRTLIHVPAGAMFNRHLARLSIANEFAPALHRLQRTGLVWIDCEALERRHNFARGTLIVLDVLTRKADAGRSSEQLHPLPLAARQSILYQDLVTTGIAEAHNQLDCPQPDHVYVPPAYEEPELSELWSQLKAFSRKFKGFYEGVVAKRADSIYPVQLRSSSLEFPFWKKHRWAF